MGHSTPNKNKPEKKRRSFIPKRLLRALSGGRFYSKKQAKPLTPPQDKHSDSEEAESPSSPNDAPQLVLFKAQPPRGSSLSSADTDEFTERDDNPRESASSTEGRLAADLVSEESWQKFSDKLAAEEARIARVLRENDEALSHFSPSVVASKQDLRRSSLPAWHPPKRASLAFRESQTGEASPKSFGGWIIRAFQRIWQYLVDSCQALRAWLRPTPTSEPPQRHPHTRCSAHRASPPATQRTLLQQYRRPTAHARRRQEFPLSTARESSGAYYRSLRT